MKKVVKSLLKIIFILSLSGVIAYAYSYVANEVGYTPMDNTWEVDNVKDAIDDLHTELDIYNNRGYKNLKLPNVSSDDSHIISSSYNAVSSEYAYYAFDGVDGTFWTSDPYSTLPQYIGWDFQEKVAVYEFSIQNRYNAIDTTVGQFSLQGYRRGEWETIQSYNHTNKTKAAIVTYTVDYPKYYYKYRLYITGEGVRGDKYIQITQINFKYIKHNDD